MEAGEDLCSLRVDLKPLKKYLPPRKTSTVIRLSQDWRISENCQALLMSSTQSSLSFTAQKYDIQISRSDSVRRFIWTRIKFMRKMAALGKFSRFAAVASAAVTFSGAYILLTGPEIPHVPVEGERNIALLTNTNTAFFTNRRVFDGIPTGTCARKAQRGLRREMTVASTRNLKSSSPQLYAILSS